MDDAQQVVKLLAAWGGKPGGKFNILCTKDSYFVLYVEHMQGKKCPQYLFDR